MAWFVDNETGTGRRGEQGRKWGKMNTVREMTMRGAPTRRAPCHMRGESRATLRMGTSVMAILACAGMTLSATTTYAEEWLGTVSNDWHNPANWDSGVPAGTLDVLVDRSVPNPLVLGSGLVDLNGKSIAVSFYGDAALTISGGATLNVGQATITSVPGSTGLVTVTDAGSTWETDNLAVGYAGQAELMIQNGGAVTSNVATIARNGGSGTVTVDGVGSRWDIGAGGASWGNYGAAEVTISNGGVVTVGNSVLIGNMDGSSGDVTVDGAGSRLEVGKDLFIGYHGSGSLEITDGGYVEADIVLLGSNTAGNTASLILDGAGSELHADGGIQIGFANTEALKITGGAGLYTGRVEQNPFIGRSYVGWAQPRGQTASVLISGAGSVWEDANYIIMGYSQSDTTIIVEDGGALRGVALDVGRGRGIDTSNPSDPFYGESRLLVSGTGTTVDFDWLAVGNAGAKATADISAGAVVTTGETYIGGGGTSSGGIYAFSDADLILRGAGTLWNTTDTGERSFFVDNGTSRIHISDQARLEIAGDMDLGGNYFGIESVATLQMTVDTAGTVHTGGNVLLAHLMGSVVTATIDGIGSEWIIDGDLVVGAAGNGTLRVLDGAVVGAGGLAGNGAVLIDDVSTLTAGGNNTNTTFGGVMEGAGAFVKTGSGILTLTGENTLTGQVTIDQGTLSLGNGGVGGSIAGDIFNDNNFLAFNRSDDATYAGVLSGSGATSFIGSGMTTLTGDSGGLTGPVFVADGNLRLASGASLGATLLTVGTDGTLSGLGSIAGDVSVEGRLAPGGDTIGTFTVTGDVAFQTGSTYAIRIAGTNPDPSPAATIDSLMVGGTADLTDGTVEIAAIDPRTSYVDGHTYATPILSATGGLGGTEFAGVGMTSDSAFITPTLSYAGNDVFLTIALTRDFTTAAETFNQFQAAGALNGLEQTGDALAVFNTIANMNADDARHAFDLTSGEVHAAGQHVIDQTFALFGRTLRYQGVAGIGAGPGTGIVGAQTFTAPLGYGPAVAASNAGVVAIDDATTQAYADARVRGAWAAPLGGFGHVDADGNAGKLDWWNAGLAGGYEGAVDVASGKAVGGFGFGYIHSRGTVDDRLSTFDADGFYLGAYGAWTDGAWNLAGSLSYGGTRVSTERNIAFMGTTAEASYWTHTIGLSGEAAYAFDLADTTKLAPLFTLDAGWSGHGGFTETGAGALNLTSGSQSWTRLDAGLGLALTHTVLTESGKVTLEGRAVWEHAFSDVVPSQALALAGSSSGFTVLGPDAGRDRLRIGAGLSWDVSDDMTLRARYDGLFSGNQANHAASLGLHVRF